MMIRSDKEVLEEMTINELTNEIKNNIHLDKDTEHLAYEVLANKQSKLIKKMYHALVTSNNLYCTDLELFIEEHKDYLFFLDNNELLAEINKEMGVTE